MESKFTDKEKDMLIDCVLRDTNQRLVKKLAEYNLSQTARMCVTLFPVERKDLETSESYNAPLNDMPLYINDPDPSESGVAKGRLSIGK